jgi:WD40 repeat protein
MMNVEPQRLAEDDLSLPASKRPRTSTPNLVEFKRLAGHTGAVSSVRFSPDGKYLASACKSWLCYELTDQHLTEQYVYGKQKLATFVKPWRVTLWGSVTSRGPLIPSFWLVLLTTRRFAYGTSLRESC